MPTSGHPVRPHDATDRGRIPPVRLDLIAIRLPWASRLEDHRRYPARQDSPPMTCSYLVLVDILQWAPLLGALGVGSVIGTWFAGSSARRETRSAILNDLVDTEKTRQATDPNSKDYPEFAAAVHTLQRTALIARIPQAVVHHYVVFAHTARYLSFDALDFDPLEQEFWGATDPEYDALVREAAAILTNYAWNPWRTRIFLREELRGLRKRAIKLEIRGLKEHLADAQRWHGTLPGQMSRLPGLKAPREVIRFDDDDEGDDEKEGDAQ